MIRTVFLWTAIIGLILLGTMSCAPANVQTGANPPCVEDVEYYVSYDVDGRTITEPVCKLFHFPFVKDIQKNYPEGTVYKVWYGLSVINFWFETETECIVVCTLFQSEEDLEIALSENWRAAKVEWTGTADCDFMDERLAESLAE